MILTPAFTSPGQLLNVLRLQGYAVLSPQAVCEIAGCKIDDLVTLAPSWNDLKADAYSMSLVRMHRLTPAEIEQYLSTGLWQGKAGGYGIQDPNPIVTCTAGSVDTVMGLPMKQTKDLLQRACITPTPQ